MRPRDAIDSDAEFRPAMARVCRGPGDGVSSTPSPRRGSPSWEAVGTPPYGSLLASQRGGRVDGVMRDGRSFRRADDDAIEAVP